MSFDTIRTLITEHGYWIIALITLAGNLGLPVPEETTVLFAGYAAQQGLLSYGWVLVVCTLSAIVGDNLGFWIGKSGGRAVLLKYGRFVGIRAEHLHKAESFFAKHGAKTVFFARFIAGLRFLAGPLSGVSHMEFKRFFFFNATGAVIWVLIISQLGYRLGPHVHLVLEKANWVLPPLVIGALLMYFIKKKRRA